LTRFHYNVKKYPPSIGAVCGNCTSSFGTVISQFINGKFRDEVSLLESFNQEQQMMFLLSSACSTQRKGKETYWCTCCPIKAQFGLRARHVHWAVKGHLGLFIALLGSSSFSSDMFGLGQIQLGSFKPSQSPMVSSRSISAPPSLIRNCCDLFGS
jgi:hypothetical protein